MGVEPVTGHGPLNDSRARLHSDELLARAERWRAATVLRPSRLGLLRPRALWSWRRRSRPTAADRAVLEVSIRYAGAGDAIALARLAALDSSTVPAQPLLVAEVGGSLLAAMSLWDGRVIADPFRPTGALIELLTVRAAQIQAAAGALHDLRSTAPRRASRSAPGSERA